MDETGLTGGYGTDGDGSVPRDGSLRGGPFGAGSNVTSDGSPCPYGMPHAHDMRYFLAQSCDPAAYGDALALGWRRSGSLFYRNACGGGCAACVPIRVDAERIAPTKSQRRAIRMNADLSVTAGPQEFREEDFALFTKYLRARHPEDAAGFDERAYVASYVASPVESAIVRYRTPDGALAALSFVDALPDGLSSVYFAFDPAESRRSLGSYSVFAECALARSLGMRWYYLGFWIAGSRKMDYKAGFRPHELARDGEWVSARERDPAGEQVARDARSDVRNDGEGGMQC